MKKFKLFALLLAFIAMGATTVGCTNDNPGTDNPGGQTDEVKDVVLECTSQEFSQNVGEVFNPLAGVTATGTKGEDVLDQVEVSTTAKRDENGVLTQSGTYQVKYVLTIDGTKYNMYRTLTVIYVAPDTDDLVVNGDFESGSVDPFTKSEFDNGAMGMSVVDKDGSKKLCLDITSVSWQLVSPRLETNTFALTQGNCYKLSFKASAETNRAVVIQIGELLTADPWIHLLGLQTFDITTTEQEFTLTFMAEGSADFSKIQVLFGFGTIDGHEFPATKVYLDDIKVEAGNPADIVIPEKPDVEYADDNNLFGTPVDTFFGAEADSKKSANANRFALWYVQDAGWSCGPATNATASLEGGKLTVNTNLTDQHWWFATQLFYTTKAFKAAGDHTLTFTLNSTVAGKMTICGKVVDIVVGDNEISVPFSVEKDACFTFSAQYGWLEEPDVSHQFLGQATTIYSDFAIDGNKAPAGEDNKVDMNVTPSTEVVEGNIWGTVAKLESADETVAKANHYTFVTWNVQDASWNCGPVNTLDATYAGGVLDLKASIPAGSYFWGVQAFYYVDGVAGNTSDYYFTCKVRAAKACQITIRGQVFDLVAGDNEIKLNVAAGVIAEGFGFTFQLGNADTQQPYVGSIELKLYDFVVAPGKVDIPQGEVPTAPEGNVFGNPTEVVAGGEADAKGNHGKFYFWHVADAGWGIGPANDSTATINNGEVTLTTNMGADSVWFATQLFYYVDGYRNADFGFKLTLNINASVDTVVTINHQEFNLKAGDNTIEINYAAADVQAQIGVSMQVGSESANTPSTGALTLVLSNFNLVAVTA